MSTDHAVDLLPHEVAAIERAARSVRPHSRAEMLSLTAEARAAYVVWKTWQLVLDGQIDVQERGGRAVFGMKGLPPHE